MTVATIFRTCPTTGLRIDRSAENLIKVNAVAAVVFLLVGGLFGLSVALTRWPAVHLLPADWFYLRADRARHRRAARLDHLLRDGRAVFRLRGTAQFTRCRATLGDGSSSG